MRVFNKDLSTYYVPGTLGARNPSGNKRDKNLLLNTNGDGEKLDGYKQNIFET